MSAFGTKRTSKFKSVTSAFGGIADVDDEPFKRSKWNGQAYLYDLDSITSSWQF
jgi:hypothetical protein